MGLVSGETARQLNGLVEQGALGAKAFDTLRNALGQFSGSMELQSRTFTGRLSTMKDALNAFIGERTRGLFESLKVAMEGFTRVLTSREMETAMDRLSGLFIGGALAAGITAAWAALAKLVAEMKVLVWVVQSTNLATGLGMMFTTAQVAAMGLAAQIGLVVTAMWTLVEAWRALNAQQAMTDARAGLEATTTRARTGLEEEIQRRVASGSLSADRAAALRADLAAGFAGKEVPKYAYESTFTGGVQRVRRGSETVRDADAEAAAIKRVGEALREVEQARVGNAEMLGPTSDEVTLQERYLAGRKALSDNNRALEQWLADQEANEGGSIYGPTADEVAKQEDYLRQREDRFAEMEQAAALYRAEQAAANNFTTQLRSEMQQLAAQWGTMAQGMARAITGTVVNAVQGLSNALANVIVGTQSAAQAFSQFAVQMLTSFIASILQMILWAKVAIPILTALGILSGGSVPAAGAVATPTALAAGMAASAGVLAFDAGGPVFGGEQLIRVNERGPEFVMSADAVRHYGMDVLSRMNAGAGAGDTGDPMRIVIVDDRRRAEELLRDPRFRSRVVDLAT